MRVGNLRTSHIVEAVVWLGLVLVLYLYSFKFEGDIEIYKFGATAWPRAILLLVAIAAIGQLIYNCKKGDAKSESMMANAMADTMPVAVDARDAQSPQKKDHNSFNWYLHTFFLLSIPFIYLNLPDFIAAMMAWQKPGLHATKLIIAAIAVGVYLWSIKGNHVGGLLALPILFGVFLQDFGFYAMAPLFVVAVMFLMGERRIKSMLMVAAGLYALLLFLFLSLLYVGLPTGNISPFYEFGTQLVNLLQ